MFNTDLWKKEIVRKKGLEPLRPFGHQLLRLARLPIPPLPLGASIAPPSFRIALARTAGFCYCPRQQRCPGGENHGILPEVRISGRGRGRILSGLRSATSCRRERDGRRAERSTSRGHRPVANG